MSIKSISSEDSTSQLKVKYSATFDLTPSSEKSIAVSTASPNHLNDESSDNDDLRNDDDDKLFDHDFLNYGSYSGKQFNIITIFNCYRRRNDFLFLKCSYCEIK